MAKIKIFLGAFPQTLLDGRANGAWRALGTRRAYGTLSPPPRESRPARSCASILYVGLHVGDCTIGRHHTDDGGIRHNTHEY